MNLRAWLKAILVAEDDLGDAVLSPNDPRNGRTISAHAATARNSGKLWGCVLCKVLDLFQRGHCDKALAGDEQRAEAVIDELKASTSTKPLL